LTNWIGGGTPGALIAGKCRASWASRKFNCCSPPSSNTAHASSFSTRHSAPVLFVIAQAGAPERAQILDAIFDLSREEILKGVEGRTLGEIALNAHDYVYDVFPSVAAGWA